MKLAVVAGGWHWPMEAYRVILDYESNWNGEQEQRFLHGHCFVDGKEVRRCFYIDTDAGVAKTYDVLGDDKTYLFSKLPIMDRAFARATESGLAYKEVRGPIELLTKDGEKICI